MKYSIAIIALLGMTQAIKIRDAPAAAAPTQEMNELGGAPAAAPAKDAAAAAPAKDAAAAPAKADAKPAEADAANAKDAAPADGSAAKKVDVKLDDGAAEKAAEPEKAKTKEKAIVAEALKTSDDDSQDAVNKAGTKIDTTNAPVAIDAPAKKAGDEKPPKLTEAENTRNAVVRNATVGQEAILNNER